jgi:DNA gyrase subunit A
MEKFKLTQIQAQAILEIQLQRLTHLEREKIVQEYEEIKALIVKLKKILSSDKLVTEIISGEMKEIKGAYADARRTELRDEVVGDLRAEDLIKEEDVVMTTPVRLHSTDGPCPPTTSRSGGKGRKGSA